VGAYWEVRGTQSVSSSIKSICLSDYPPAYISICNLGWKFWNKSCKKHCITRRRGDVSHFATEEPTTCFFHFHSQTASLCRAANTVSSVKETRTGHRTAESTKIGHLGGEKIILDWQQVACLRKICRRVKLLAHKVRLGRRKRQILVTFWPLIFKGIGIVSRHSTHLIMFTVCFHTQPIIETWAALDMKK